MNNKSMTINPDVVFCEQDAPKDAISYSMRTECQTDAFIIRAALAQWVYTWSEEWDVWEGRRAPWDMHVRFQLAWNPPAFSELQWLVSSLTDCHIAAESLRPTHAYTAERVPFEEVYDSMARPSDKTIRKARDGIRGTLKWLPVLRNVLMPERHRMAAELGRPTAYLSCMARQLTRSWQDTAIREGKPFDAEAVTDVALEHARVCWEDRVHR